MPHLPWHDVIAAHIVYSPRLSLVHARLAKPAQLRRQRLNDWQTFSYSGYNLITGHELNGGPTPRHLQAPLLKDKRHVFPEVSRRHTVRSPDTDPSCEAGGFQPVTDLPMLCVRLRDRGCSHTQRAARPRQRLMPPSPLL